MKFIVDENVPAKLAKALEALGHQAVKVDLSSSDLEIARRARNEGGVLVTLDKDFVNIAAIFPKEFDIVLIRIHPPYAHSIISAFQKLTLELAEKDFHGLILLSESGHIRVVS